MTDIPQLVSSYFLRDDNAYGCAETTYMVLKKIFGLRNPMDSSPAMVFNGGFAYSGGLCGALTGAALAIGELAGREIADHQRAKREARKVMQRVVEQFIQHFGSSRCMELTGYDFTIEGAHHRFIEDRTWRVTCTAQIVFVVQFLADCSFTEAAEREIPQPSCGQTLDH